MTPRSLLSIAQHRAADLREMLQMATDVSLASTKPLAGLGVAMIFEKPSNRTRHSMEMAVVQLGGHPVYTRGEEVGFDVRETVEDITKILCGYHGIVAARVFDHQVLERMRVVSTRPIVNMLSDESHPLQALADVITMEEVAGSVSGQPVAWIGDYNNVARSLGEAVCLLGGRITFGCPVSHGPGPAECARLSGLGGQASWTEDPAEAAAGARFIHTDTWVSMGQESDGEERRRIFSPYQVTTKLMKTADPSAHFLHCMPAHRGEEVEADVFDGPQSLVIRQGHHRLTAARGALCWLVSSTESRSAQ